jgi:NTE family protein
VPRTRPPYPEEFRREAVELVRVSGRRVSEVARDLGCSEQTLRNWIRQAQVDSGEREGRGLKTGGAAVEGKTGKQPRIAIACEGGGSHTAFTAGVLRRLLREQIEIVALSGTCGGAVCAMLAWRGLLDGDRDDAIERVEAFWRDNAAEGLEALQAAWLLLGIRFVGEVLSPEVSPYRYESDAKARFRELLERHCGFAEVPRLLAGNPAAPRLLIGAADVRSGEFAVFRSHPVTHRGERYPAASISADVILASAAVPSFFRAVHIDGRDYWDGVFAQNPPIRELPDMVRTIPGRRPPDEIWVVRINPRSRAAVPTSMADIRDRRNELAGMISLEQELYFIDFLNDLVETDTLGGTKHRPITLDAIEMSHPFAAELDYESKLDRSRPFIEALEKHGYERADRFLREERVAKRLEELRGPRPRAGQPREAARGAR